LGISEAIITGVSNHVFAVQGFCQAAYCIYITNTAIVLTWTRLGKRHAT